MHWYRARDESARPVMLQNVEFEALFGAALDAVLVIDDGRGFVDANPAACQLLGVAHEGLIGRRIEEFLQAPAGDVADAWRLFLAAGFDRSSLRVLRPDGESRDVEYTATARFSPGRHLAVLRDVTDRRRAERERADLLQREQVRLRETETLLAISRALSATLDPTETMRRVAREIAHALHADMVGAYLADAAHTTLRPIAGYHVPPHLVDEFIRYPIPIKDHPAIEEAWARRDAVWTEDMTSDPRVDPSTFQRFPHQTDLFVPIRIKDAPVGGFFVIWWTERRAITPEELRLLRAISDLAGIFLENAQLHRNVMDASRRKDIFLATLSHELRNPLAAMSAAASALARPGVHDATAVRLREIIERQARHLARLLDDLLDVARLTAGKITLQQRSVDLAELAGACVRGLRDGGDDHRHRITLRTERAVIGADPTRIEQILTNLLDNARKYTPPGGHIDVQVTADGLDAVLRVTDTGIGIAPEMLDSIFDLFTQGGRRDDPAGGLGLGLTVARRLVEMHGGSITATSEGIGRGSCFTVRLPRSEVPVRASTERRAPGPCGPRKILVIEDNDDAREALSTLLAVLGHHVLAVPDGDRGVAMALETRPDIALIDIGLPGIDGLEVARALRSTPQGRRMRLIAVTGYGQPQDREQSSDAGFDAHLVKPVEQDTLVQALEERDERSTG